MDVALDGSNHSIVLKRCGLQGGVAMGCGLQGGVAIGL